LADITGKLFLDVDELHDVSGVSITELKRAVDRGLKDGSLQHYSGKNRKSVYRAEQLDILLENLPPTAPPKPPKKKPREEQGEI
jgi:transposase